jgi:transcriptional regulator with XRE-family HTH domain
MHLWSKGNVYPEKLMGPNESAPRQPAAGSPQGQDAGAIVRAARLAAGLTLADLGRRCGYSASQVSRYERGLQALTDITLLRRFSQMLAIPPQAFGLTPADGSRAGRHAVRPKEGHPRVGWPRVSREPQWEDGEDPVRRRELLAGAAGLVGAATLGLPSVARNTVADPGAGLEEMLYHSTANAEPVPLATLRTAVTGIRADFQNARYDRMAASLPALIATGTATRDHAASDERATASTLLADAYITATNFMVKLNDDPLAWTTADRALLAAQAGDDPLTLAEARRAVATVLRRTGRPAQARDLLLSAASAIEPGHRPTPGQLSMYGTLLEVAAYTAAVDGNRHAAAEYIGEAAAAAARLGSDANHRFTAFGPSGVILYQVSVAQVLGDSGTAIEYARKLHPAVITTAERRGRYWVDVARAYHQWGKPEPCYRALLSAERAAPAEVSYRPPVHRMTKELLRADRRRSLPGLRAFARRIGVPDA